MSETFDYIIIGAGSAGCVLANKLTENGKHKVLLLESGGHDKRFFIQMPLGYGKTFYDPKVNWMFEAEPDPGLNNQADLWPRGKIIGGSSSINAMVYIRGDASDYDDWEQAGNKGWGWKDVMPAFKQIEDLEGGGNDHRGQGGPLFISNNNNVLHKTVQNFLEAAQGCGLQLNPDFNAKTQEGVGHFQTTIKTGRRNSAARAFLDPIKRRKNLCITTKAHVTRILFEGTKAIGVEYSKVGKLHQAKANAEVILSGGAVNSPQLLQLSGIGDAAHLGRLGIETILHNPNVGRNLKDHQGINYTFRLNVPTLNDQLRPLLGKLKAGLSYVLMRQGPLALSINQGGGFFKTNAARTRPNMQLYYQAFSTLIPKAGERPILSPDPFSGASIGLSNCRPTSVGEIMIRSADPFAQPKISANVFSTDHDVQEMLEAVKFIRKIASQPAFARLVEEELRPGPKVQSDADLIHDLRQRSGTVYHPSCTARMAKTAKLGVIDAEFKVHGMQNLRVIDASSFPNILSGNLNAAAMMVGWRGADMILKA